MKPIFRFSSWDFATILKTTAFVDKTLLIRTLFEEKGRVLVTAPHLSGKSTSLNMVKRYLEIIVDEKGERIEPRKTSNYKLFTDNNLKIFSNLNLFAHDHFGKYPVIFIDYKSLGTISSFKTMVEQFREILLNTFEQHEYLAESAHLWSSEISKDLFSKYCQTSGNFSLSESEIRNGFVFLSKLLFKHFNKEVYILMDEYDAFVDSPVLKGSPDRDRIIAFIYGINCKLFKWNKYAFRALITGVLRHNSVRLYVPRYKILPNNVIEYNFRKPNPFCKYYGITPDELDGLLTKFFGNHKEREKAKSTIIVKSTIMEQNTQIYNMWSVLRYLSNVNASSEIAS